MVWAPRRWPSRHHRLAPRRFDRLAVVCTAFLLSGVATYAAPQKDTLAVAQAPPTAATSPSANTLEAFSPSLAASLQRQTAEPTLLNEERLGFDYLAAGVLDTAYDHFQAALRLDPRDAAANDAIARIWRDWNFPASALPYAYRAAFWSPESASVQNTLGTVLLKLGQIDAARSRFERARTLDPTAVYPLNNLCYASMHVRDFSGAGDWCRAALAADPGSEQARNNLALSLALSGDLRSALDVLSQDERPASAAYNQAVLLLAARQRSEARDALGRARTADPKFLPALKLLRQLVNRPPEH